MVLRSAVRSFRAGTWSYVHGVSTRPLIFQTMGQVLAKKAEAQPDKTVFVFPHQNVRKSYADFFADSKKLASGLMSLGLAKGDRVGIWAPNIYEWVVAQFATAMAGMILTNVTASFQAQELEYCLKKVGMKALISASSFKTSDFYEIICTAVPEIRSSSPGQLQVKRFPLLKHVIMIGGSEGKPGTWDLAKVTEAGDSKSDRELADVGEKLQPDDPINIQFTSGTTGRPKGVTLTHHNIINNARLVSFRAGYHEREHVLCVPLPLAHCFGGVAGALAGVVHGSSVVVPSPSFQALPALQAIHQEKCTALYGTPTMFVDMLGHPDFPKYNYDSLITGMIGGAPCPVHLCQRVMERFGIPEFTVAYGMTENSPVTFMSLRSDPIAVRLGNVGYALDHVETKIVDGQGQVLPREHTGELCTRGHVVMRGYWEDEEKTKKEIGEDGWFRTGDLATMDNAGRVQIVGRSKDMILRGGENIYPAEVEQFLHTHPDILDAQVVGVPDERLGEVVCAWIRLRTPGAVSPEQIKDFCLGKIAYFKIPLYIFLKKEGEFPMTLSGKIQKFKMREISTAQLGLRPQE